jgi:hypothetical protein
MNYYVTFGIFFIITIIIFVIKKLYNVLNEKDDVVKPPVPNPQKEYKNYSIESYYDTELDKQCFYVKLFDLIKRCYTNQANDICFLRYDFPYKEPSRESYMSQFNIYQFESTKEALEFIKEHKAYAEKQIEIKNLKDRFSYTLKINDDMSLEKVYPPLKPIPPTTRSCNESNCSTRYYNSSSPSTNTTKENDSSSKFAESMIVGAVTNSTILGTIVGGSLLGAVMGDSLNND